jgi:hypothetical protein
MGKETTASTCKQYALNVYFNLASYDKKRKGGTMETKQTKDKEYLEFLNNATDDFLIGFLSNCDGQVVYEEGGIKKVCYTMSQEDYDKLVKLAWFSMTSEDRN